MSALDAELAALGTMSRAQLRTRWQEIDGSPAPEAPASLMRQLVAHRLQERRYGRLPALVRRELLKVAEGGTDAVARKRVAVSPGMRLVREWNGQTIAVEVLEDGFRYAERTWRSLSEIARHVTGAHWSGPRFFGLAPHG